MNCTLHFLHRAVREANSHIDFHRHPMFEIVYYRSGTGTTAFEHNEYRYEPGIFTVLRANTDHNEIRHTDTEVVYFGFYCDQTPVELNTGMHRDFAFTIRGLIEQMDAEMNAKKSHYELKINALLQAVIIEVLRLQSPLAPSASGEERHIWNARHYMDQYFSEKVNLTQLSALSGYSYDHFRHLFKDEVGVTPMQYLRQLRIDKAITMMRGRDSSLTDVALECGFTSLSQFSATFRRITGKKPSAYRV
ncbi:helix-turn-helix transcriptional regulator [Paenibacillus thalictri]|uniref:AraC family transcriptional regulator n=1 Tax=Paenibacillus thalictri TaxID=2527873 RepID=A0A4Q9DNB1_9BACL|nr:AraC family transcriptional regulator [Paenibacillus thalictri]TBL73933.1 AraC family transcriptional regulator [Paenibacillus thalictri]